MGPNAPITLTRFIIEEQRRSPGAIGELGPLVGHIGSAVKAIGHAVSRGALDGRHGHALATNVHGERQQKLDLAANDLLLRACEWGGHLAGMASEELEEPYAIPGPHPCGRYLLVFDPLDGSSNIDVNVSVGTIFSILRRPDGAGPASLADFLQPGSRQVCAGYAIYGPATTLVLTVGRGVHGFTLDRELGEFVLTHRDLRIPESAREFAINASNERFWEPPVRRYVQECLAGRAGPRGADFNMRWVASLVADVHRILLRGGVFLYPRDTKVPGRAGRLRLLYEANPMAMIVEQAGGAATTGRSRILDLAPRDLHERVPLVLGSKEEVERIVRYHAEDLAGANEAQAPAAAAESLVEQAG